MGEDYLIHDKVASGERSLMLEVECKYLSINVKKDLCNQIRLIRGHLSNPG